MNRLIRGIGVRCADGLARGRHAPPPPALRGSLPRHITPRDGDGVVGGCARGFSAVVDAAPQQQQEQQQVAVVATPSALEMASQLPPTSPGHALGALQRFAAAKRVPKGKRPPPFGPIRQSDFVALCESSRPGSFKDGKVVATALREFKRNSRFVLDTHGAESAVRGMLRSMTRNHPDGSGRAAGAIFVLDQVMDETTGLYFAIETRLVDEMLDVLHSALLEMQASGIDVKVAPAPAPEEGEDAEESGPTDRHVLIVRDALRTTLGVNDLLVRRKSRPERELKKRAKRKYLNHLQIGSGPYRTTLRLATKITLLVSDAKTARERIVEPFNMAWWTKFVDEEVLEMVAEAEGREEEERRAAEAALPQEEEESDEVDGEGEDADSEDSQDKDEAETEQKS